MNGIGSDWLDSTDGRRSLALFRLQALPEFLGAEVSGQEASVRKRNLAGFFGYHDNKCIRLFGKTDCSPVPGSHRSIDERRLREAKNHGSGRRDAILSDDHRTIV